MRSFTSSTYFRVTAALFLVLFTTLMLVDRPTKIEKRIVERREVQGKAAPTHWLVPVWLWHGLALNTALAAVLVALTPLARRPAFPSPVVPTKSKPFSSREKILLTASVVLLAASTAPRLGQSLWGDEEFCMKAFIAPQPTQQPDGSVTLQPTPWMTTIWDYQKPTNHIGFIIIARLVHDTFFTPGTGPTDPWFSETLMRLPSFLAGLASILTLVWCCRVWGLRHGIAWIALAYAGHAWVIRYGCDARSYGFVLMLIPVLLGTLGRASQTDLWRWWLGFAFTQFYLLWAYTGVIHIPIAANLLALALLWRHPSSHRLPLSARWLAANLITCILVIGIMAPCLPTFIDFLKEKRLQGDLDISWWRDAATSLFCGAIWHPFEIGNPHATSVSQAPLPPLISALWITLGGLTALLGSWKLWQSPERRPLLIFLFAGPALLIAHLIAGHTRPYLWYLIPILPNVLILWAAAWPAANARLRLPQISLILLTLTGVHILALPTARLLTRFPIESCRESVAVTRPIVNPRHPGYGTDTLTASPGMATEAYDPAVIRIKTPEDLLTLIDRARREKKPLFLNFAFRTLLKDKQPAIFALIDDPSLFEPVQTYPGQFVATTREVFRLRP